MFGSFSLLEVGVAVALLTCLGGALISALTTECKECSKVALLVGGLPLGSIGTAGYSLLLALFLHRPESAWVQAGLAAALGTHLLLVQTLRGARALCPPCLVTAGGAFLGAALSIPAGTAAWWQIPVVVAAYLLSRRGTEWWAARYRLRSMIRTKLAAKALAEAHRSRLPELPLQLVAFSRQHCAACDTFRKRDLPLVLEHYGDQVEVQERIVAEDEFMTPAAVVLTPGAPMVFPTFYCSQWEILGRLDDVIREGLRERSKAREAVVADSGGRR